MAQAVERRLDIESLRALLAIDRLGGVTKAARDLGVSQSAVSHRIKRLEDQLDAELLQRKPASSIFTTAGLELLEYARRILAIHDEALTSISKSAMTGNISFGVVEEALSESLTDRFARFRGRHPGVTLHIQVDVESVLRDQIATGAIDAAVIPVFEHDVRPSDELLFTEQMHWVKSPDLHLPKGFPIPFLSTAEFDLRSKWAKDIGQDAGAVLDTVFDCKSLAGILSAVETGIGVALLTQRHLSSDIQIVRDGLPTPPKLAFVLRVARNQESSACDAFVAEVRKALHRL